MTRTHAALSRPLARLLAGAAVCATTALIAQGAQASADAAAPRHATHDRRALMEGLPVIFEPAGDQGGAFIARGTRYRALLHATQALVAAPAPAMRHDDEGASRSPDAALTLRFTGTREGVALRGAEPGPGRSNYFLGADPVGWRVGVPHYGRVVAEQLYPGIDVVWYGRGGELEFDLVVAPGADPGRIVLEIGHAGEVRPDGDGGLLLSVPAGEFRLRRPVMFQHEGDSRSRVDGRYTLAALGDSRWKVGFEIAGHDPGRALIIDPILGYASRAGGRTTDVAQDVAADAAGNAYVVGWTDSADFTAPDGTTPGLLGSGGGADVFVYKLTPDGSTVLFATFIGGTSFDNGLGIGLDRDGNVYVAGTTSFLDSGFPSTPNAYRTVAADFFLSKLDPSGSTLLYSTFFGGLNIGSFAGLAVQQCGASACAYLAGSTVRGHPTTGNAYARTLNGGSDAFLAVFDPSQPVRADQLVYSTVFGGSGGDRALDVAAGPDGKAYLKGDASDDLPLRHAFDATRSGNREAFLAVFDPWASGNDSLLYSTYIGGDRTENDSAGDGGIAVGPDGVALVTGTTDSFDFPITPEGFRTFRQSVDAYFVAVDPSRPGADSLRYSTYLGGSSVDHGTDVAAGPAGIAYVAGYTQSGDLPDGSGDPAPKLGDGSRGFVQDAFLVKIDWTRVGNDSLLDAAYVGGSDADFTQAVAADGFGNAFIAGQTSSRDGFHPQPGDGSFDAFVARIGTVIALPTGTVGTPSTDLLSSNFGTPPYTWAPGSGDPPQGLVLAADGTLSGVPAEPGEATFTAQVTDANGATHEQAYRKRIGTGPQTGQILLRKGAGDVALGRITEYYILVRNLSDQTLTNVKVFEEIEPWFRFVSAVPPPDELRSNLMLASDFPQLAQDITLDRIAYWTIPTMAPGELKVISYEVRLSAEAQLGALVSGKACQDDDMCSDEAVECLEAGYKACEAICAAENWFDLPTDPGGLLWDGAVGAFSEAKCKGCFDLATNHCRGQYFSCLNAAAGRECMELSPAEGTEAGSCCDSVERPVRAPLDPNAKAVTSPTYIPPGEVLGYTVYFENLGDIEARDVFVTDVLDADVDVTTVRVRRPGGPLVPLPVDGTVTLFDDDDERWEVTLDGATRTLSWRLINIDLPPGVTDSLFFVVTAPDSLASGTEIRNAADIQFEVLDVFTTNETLNIVDATAPDCTVDPLPAQTFGEEVFLTWSGADPLGELARFFLYVSVDGGPFGQLPPTELLTAMTFRGELGRSYAFVCIAQDTAGNSEPLDMIAEAVTTLVEQVPNQPPVAEAGADAPARPGETVSLDGSASHDPDGGPQPLGFRWVFLSVPAASALTDADIAGALGATPSFVPDAPGLYVLELTVSDGEAEDSDTVEIQVQAPAPDAVTDLTARAKSGKVSLVWTPIAGALAYDVYRGTGAGGPYALIAAGHESDYATYSDLGLTNGQTYYYVVRSVGAGGAVSEDSNEASASPSDRVRRGR